MFLFKTLNRIIRSVSPLRCATQPRLLKLVLPNLLLTALCPCSWYRSRWKSFFNCFCQQFVWPLQLTAKEPPFCTKWLQNSLTHVALSLKVAKPTERVPKPPLSIAARHHEHFICHILQKAPWQKSKAANCKQNVQLSNHLMAELRP